MCGLWLNALAQIGTGEMLYAVAVNVPTFLDSEQFESLSNVQVLFLSVHTGSSHIGQDSACYIA